MHIAASLMSAIARSYVEFFRFMLQFLCLQVCASGGSAVPEGGWGTVTWQPSTRGWWGTVFLGLGKDRGGGGGHNTLSPDLPIPTDMLKIVQACGGAERAFPAKRFCLNAA